MGVRGYVSIMTAQKCIDLSCFKGKIFLPFIKSWHIYQNMLPTSYLCSQVFPSSELIKFQWSYSSVCSVCKALCYYFQDQMGQAASAIDSLQSCSGSDSGLMEDGIFVFREERESQPAGIKELMRRSWRKVCELDMSLAREGKGNLAKETEWISELYLRL